MESAAGNIGQQWGASLGEESLFQKDQHYIGYTTGRSLHKSVIQKPKYAIYFIFQKVTVQFFVFLAEVEYLSYHIHTYILYSTLVRS